MHLRSLVLSCTLLGLVPLLAAGEPSQPPPGQLELPDFAALAQKASHSVVVSLDPSLLSVAGGLLSADSNPNDAAVKELIGGLRGVYVRSFSFDQPGDYSSADVDALRARLQSPGWQPLVSTHDRQQKSDVDIYLRRTGTRTDGMVIIATQPEQLTIVNIVGNIDLAKLAQLQGRFGVPSIGGLPGQPSPASPGTPTPRAIPPP